MASLSNNNRKIQSIWFWIFLIISSNIITFVSTTNNKHVAVRDSILLITTLDGSLHAVSQRSGLIKWTLENFPILQLSPVPTTATNTNTNTNNNNNTGGDNPGRQYFLIPDPKDGSLYLLNGLSDKKPKTLEKLPFTITELVSRSPCRSSDGMIYTSKKTDEWLILNMQNGRKVDVVNVDSSTCSSTTTTTTTTTSEDRIPETDDLIPPHDLLYLFKTEYQISIFNGETREKVMNLTFRDFSPSLISSITQNSYDFVHLTSSTNGKIATIDVANGANAFLWSHQFSSPIVAIYKLTENANFPKVHSVPFFTLGGMINVSHFSGSNNLLPSVYVGEFSDSKSLYALSSFVEHKQIRKDSDYLIEGPKVDGTGDDEFDFIELLLGYYEYPKKSQIKFSQIPLTHLLPSPLIDSDNNVANHIRPFGPAADEELSMKVKTLTYWIQAMALLILLTSTIVISFCLINYRKQQSILNREKEKSQKTNAMINGNGNEITIGKIRFNSVDIIGRGCAGTCVYKGLFEDKQRVAVKRIVSDYFKLANREIDLLRKLQHPNLIRYFATENDEQFSYIALELAEMTLGDYIENKKNLNIFKDILLLDKTHILHQVCLGLAHLHSLNIVHRDIKPQNILISLPISPGGQRKIMITDFGVSKILNSDSFTTDASAGTDGWIAPEILQSKLNNGNEKASKPNDIFSLGCLIYYTFTGGEHPFGDLLNRQTSILKGEPNLDAIDGENDICLRSLIEPMISNDLNDRPSIEVILKHPFFWDEKKSLQFMQDVSDRFECENSDSDSLKALENGALDVCRGDWRRCITIELQEDLRKFRSYKGTSVRDLLRAIRNKRHHYHELDPKLQCSLGSIPNEFVKYFTTRFPRLIIHSYIALQKFSDEDVFKNYYYNPPVVEKQFKFRHLPRATYRWNDRWKEDNIAEFNVFNIRQRRKPTTPLSASTSTTASTTNNNINNNNATMNFNESDRKILLSDKKLDESFPSSSKIDDILPQQQQQQQVVTDSLFYNDVFKT